MKKTSKLLSALLLLGQVMGYTPTVLADEEQPKVPTEQSSTVNTETVRTNTSTTEDSTTANQEKTTTDSTVVQPNQSTSEPTNPTMEQTTDSSTDSSQTSETSTSGTTNSSQPEQSRQDATKPVEQPTTKSSESVTQEAPQPLKPTEVTPSPQVQQEVEQPSATAQRAQQKTEVPTQATTPEESKAYHQATTAPIQELAPSSKQDNKGSIHFEKNESVESFIRKIGESARKVGQENDLYASVMIAQAILESASGQSELAQAPNYNLFGIKGKHNGKGVSFVTQEDLGNGALYTTQATFRQYESYEDSLNDYAKLLKEGVTGNHQFYSGVWKTNAKTYQEATKFLTGRYATDTSYDKKLNGLIQTYDLTTYDKKIASPQINKKGYIVPLKNYTISSPFGNRGGEFHRGLDLAATQGEPIYASKAGTVIKAEFHPSWGNVVAIEHEDGTTALYAHQQEYQVKVGDKVKQGQIIGYVGSTGNSTGSHLHFELCRDNTLVPSQLVDPETVLF